MLSEEWALMSFTLLSQLAIGTFLMMVILRTVLSKDQKTAGELTQFGFLAVGPMMALALVLSVFHLGSPLGAYMSILNIGTSWLSREILFAGLFLVFWFVSYMSYKKVNLGNALGWVTGFVGLIVIFNMASIYASSIRPAWANVNTYIAFYGTTFVFGSLGAGLAVAYAMKGKKISAEALDLLRKIGFVAIAAVAIQLIYLPVYLSGLVSGGQSAQASAQLLSSSYAFPSVVRWILSLLGGVLLVYTLYKRDSEKGILPINPIYLALMMVIVGEVMGRYIFYASAVSTMVGIR